MTATVDFLTVTNSVAALTFTGSVGTIIVQDVDEISDTVGLDTKVLAPMPSGFISDIALTRDEISGQNYA